MKSIFTEKFDADFSKTYRVTGHDKRHKQISNHV